MYRHDGVGKSRIDSLVAMEGKFVFHPKLDAAPVIEVTVGYLSSETGDTCGKFTAMNNLFSLKTIEAFRAFLDSAEQDVGRIVLGGGTIAPFGETQVPGGQAESDQGPQLPPGLGEKG